MGQDKGRGTGEERVLWETGTATDRDDDVSI